MRKQTFILISLLISLVFNQMLGASGFAAQFYDVTKSTQSEDNAILSVEQADRVDHLAKGHKHPGHEDTNTPHTYCHCPVMSISCGAVVFDRPAELTLAPLFLLYSSPIHRDAALRGRTLGVELRPPRLLT